LLRLVQKDRWGRLTQLQAHSISPDGERRPRIREYARSSCALQSTGTYAHGPDDRAIREDGQKKDAHLTNAVRGSIPHCQQIQLKGGVLMGERITRNTGLLVEVLSIIDHLISDHDTALATLENHFQDRYILDAGDVNDVAAFATELRLDITEGERGTVLDYIATQGMVGLDIDIVENAINERFDDRFIEPGN
jgi:hypothetical protein